VKLLLSPVGTFHNISLDGPLVITTQNPSGDVVTNAIKANFPTRLAFAVASSVDSHLILNMAGAEDLLGKGDMLFFDPVAGRPIRVQGVMVAGSEIEHILSHWRKKIDVPVEVPPWEKLVNEPDDDKEEILVEEAVLFVRQSQWASTSQLQRHFRIGYPRAARLLDKLEKLGIIGPPKGGGKEREVLLGPIDAD
jgi:DNA segregation ATPase FtsK/SpoIIIE, S-DNA-T family